MSQKEHLLGILEGKSHQKLILTVSIFVLLVLELMIYLAAATHSGQKSKIIITDTNGTKVYETQGAVLTSYEKLVFENNFGPLTNYRLQVETESLPFPFRAWLSSAVGIPLGLILMVAFIVRAYLSLLYGDKTDKDKEADSRRAEQNTMGSFLGFFRNLSIFHIGFLTLGAVLVFWIVPNFVEDFAKLSVTAIREFSWFFAGVAAFLALVVVWVIFLRYRLSKQMLENQLNLEKFRVEKQLLLESKLPHLLPTPESDKGEA